MVTSADAPSKATANIGAARRRRLQKQRSTATKVEWLYGLCQTRYSHHTGVQASSLVATVMQVQRDVAALTRAVGSLDKRAGGRTCGEEKDEKGAKVAKAVGDETLVDRDEEIISSRNSGPARAIAEAAVIQATAAPALNPAPDHEAGLDRLNEWEKKELDNKAKAHSMQRADDAADQSCMAHVDLLIRSLGNADGEQPEACVEAPDDHPISPGETESENEEEDESDTSSYASVATEYEEGDWTTQELEDEKEAHRLVINFIHAARFQSRSSQPGVCDRVTAWTNASLKCKEKLVARIDAVLQDQAVATEGNDEELGESDG